MTTVRNLRSVRYRTPLLIAIGALIILLLSANGLARTYTDWLWFDHLGFGSVWTKIVVTQILLATVFTLIFFLILWGNLILADRLAPEFRPSSPEEDLIERYQQMVGSRAGRIRVGLSAIFALIAGGNTASQWQEWLLFRNGTEFGRVDPLFGRDAGFYVFTLPFIRFVVDWLFAALVLTLIIVAIAHYLNGGIRASAPLDRVTSGVKLHLSIILAALALARAADYYLDRFALVNSDRVRFDGALATDVNVQLPAYNLLALISLFGAALFLFNIRRRGWGLPMVAVGLWAVSHLVAGSIFPAVYQRLRIEPQETTREAQFVGDNIAATRFAYGLENLRIEDFAYEPGLTAEEVADYADVFDNVPLVDPFLAQESFTRSQGERAFYTFSSTLDVDRYTFGDELRPVVLSVRGLDLSVSQVGQNWEAQHIVFTHGYGAVAAAGWEVGASGRPSFVVSDLGDVSIDPELSETLDQPRIYFGEDFDGYAIVDAERDEVDYQTDDNTSVDYRYEGTGGVDMGTFIRRAAFALRFREIDPLIAPLITRDSKVIYNRDIAERVRAVAPFLRFDSNPYPIIAESQVFWVVDGYTTSDTYPYSQQVQTDILGADLSTGYNYVRNSVKAVVDAYNGDVKLYVVDESDPVLEAWANAFPDLFVDDDAVPLDIRDNFRYPEDIFRVQTDMWSTYVVSEPRQLIQGDVAWSVANQPRREAQVGEGDTAANRAMDPHYLMTRLPGSSEPEFVLQRAFVPRSGEAGSTTERPELTGVMMARSDPGIYGELVLYRTPIGVVEAPNFVHAEIRKNDQLTEFVKDTIGAVVIFGDMTMLLVNDTIVYIRPVYVEAASANAVPELSRVIAVNDDRIAMGQTLDEAVQAIVTGDSTDAAVVSGGGDGTETTDTVDDPPADEPDVAIEAPAGADGAPLGDYEPSGSLFELLADAESFLRAAEDLDAEGLTEEAAVQRANAQLAIDAAQALLGGGGTATVPATPTESGET